MMSYGCLLVASEGVGRKKVHFQRIKSLTTSCRIRTNFNAISIVNPKSRKRRHMINTLEPRHGGNVPLLFDTTFRYSHVSYKLAVARLAKD
jgi:hypothetical protein